MPSFFHLHKALLGEIFTQIRYLVATNQSYHLFLIRMIPISQNKINIKTQDFKGSSPNNECVYFYLINKTGPYVSQLSQVGMGT
jgi:hypothetical protein